MKKFWILFIILGFISISIFSISFGKEENQEIAEKQISSQSAYSIGKVTAESLKIRTGLSFDNPHIALLAKDDLVHIYGKVDNWYIVKTENNLIGAVFADYVETSFETDETIETSAPVANVENSSNIILSKDEQIFLNLINNKRIENNLPEFEIDETLLNLARLKANDIVENKYFSHTSPQYGTLFEMLDNQKVIYNKASENIARNINADSAIENLMNSESHKNNILSENFNYTGIGVINSFDYGKVFVEIFVAK